MNFFLLTSIFALISLDRKNAFQMGISQPLITSTLIGYLLGAPQQAMYFGMIVQLVWLSNLPIGAAKTPVGDIGSIIGCILYVQFYEQFAEYGQFLLLITFLYTVFCSYLANEIESLNRKVNTMLFDFLYASIKSSGKERTGIVIGAALFVQFISSLLFIIVAILVGEKVLDFLQETVVNISIDVWQYGKVAILGSGIGMLATVFKDKKSKRIVSVLSLIFLLIIISI